MQPADAHNEWYKATIEPNDKIRGIINSIIDNYKKRGIKGIPLVINRNPSMVYPCMLSLISKLLVIDNHRWTQTVESIDGLYDILR